MRNNRIGALDGLRGIAALGVLWIHCWTGFGNPRLKIAGLDITSVMALGGNGVDLFFVISGFCMYYFYGSGKSFSYKEFQKFLFRRWTRLSPAFYLITAVYIFYGMLNGRPDSGWMKAVTSLFYLNSILPQYNAEGLFWTLGVEAQFYAFLPFILIYQHKVSFKRLLIYSFVLMAGISVLSVIILKERSDLLTQQIPFRYLEFMCGIIVARILLFRKIKLNNRLLLLLLAIFVTYLGRTFISANLLDLSARYYNLFKLAGFLFMGIGFSGILLLSLTSTDYLRRLLSSNLLSSIGRISYSFYLLHGLILSLLLMHFKPGLDGLNSFTASVMVFVTSIIILIPISKFSYRLLEKPFLRSKQI